MPVGMHAFQEAIYPENPCGNLLASYTDDAERLSPRPAPLIKATKFSDGPEGIARARRRLAARARGDEQLLQH